MKVISVIHAFIPLIVTFASEIKGIDTFSNEYSKYIDPYYWAYTGALILVNGLIFYSNLEFLEIGLIDMQRRKFAMMVLESMFEPNRFKIALMLKVFPLLNYYDPSTLLAWLDMRIMLLDIG